MEVAGLEVASDLAQVPEKGHHADRFRGQGLFAPRWTAAKAAMVGYWTGRGYSSPEIAELLADGTVSSSIRGIWLKWDLGKYGLPAVANRGSIVPVELTLGERQRLERRAKRLKITPAEWLERVIGCAIDDDMFGAITG
jgi:hypothetical protein